MKTRIELSKRGLPCVWECGGAGTNTGDSRLIGDMNGRPKKAIYIATRGHLSNGEHALIPVRVNDIIVRADQWRGDYQISVYKIKSINIDNLGMELEEINGFDNGEWDYDLEDKYVDIVECAKRKASTYHCRSAYFINN